MIWAFLLCWVILGAVLWTLVAVYSLINDTELTGVGGIVIGVLALPTTIIIIVGIILARCFVSLFRRCKK